MNNLEESVPCPVCSTKIPIDVHQMLRGVQFVCSNCNAVVGLGNESRSLVDETMAKLEETKKKQK